jgi:hydrogenase small subunit
MAITRRQFVTRLGALAAAIGVSQVDLAKITEAFAHGSPWGTKWYDKPQVFWVHGAECTGCSTSLLSLFEDARGNIQGTPYSTLAALDLAVNGTGNGNAVLSGTVSGGPGAEANHPFGHRTLQNVYGNNIATSYGTNPDGYGNNSPYTVNIADVLIDFIALEYHETVMGFGGDLAYQYLENAIAQPHTKPFVLVVEGAVQAVTNTGYWNSTGTAPWCSIGQDGVTGHEAEFGAVVAGLAVQNCAAIITIGQCASFGGYPACQSPVLSQGGVVNASQTGALGVYDFLSTHSDPAVNAAAAKVIAVPGCPTNPWWFILTVVAWLVDANAVIQSGMTAPGPLGILNASLGINASAVDNTRRLKLVYGSSVHGPLCPRYQDFNNGVFAQTPGDPGCLQYIGCKGPGTLSLCAVHGWNGTNPNNDGTWEHGLVNTLKAAPGTNTNSASFCVSAGHPCMACTEKGYPDNFVPFVNRG